MNSITSKEKILKNIREALIHSTAQPFPSVNSSIPLYRDSKEPLDILFAKQFNAVSGQFIYCENNEKFAESIKLLINEKGLNKVFCWDERLLSLVQYNGAIPELSAERELEDIDAGITYCESLLARTGSIIVSSKQAAGRILTIFPPVHIIVAYISQLVYDIDEGLQKIVDKYENKIPSMISLVTGPSRTADIEKTLVLGAHGPKELIVFLIDEKKPI